MTDQRLRHLERDAAHGDLQAQARLLLERVRIGDLTVERLRLAAYLGHEAAASACLAGAINIPEVSTEARSLASGLRHFEQSISVRAVVAVARSRLPAWEHWSTTDRRPLLAIDAAESWLVCPCEQHGQAAVEAHGAALEARQPLVSLSDPKQLRDRTEAGHAQMVMCMRAGRAAYTAGEAARAAASGSARHASASLLRVLGPREDAMDLARATLLPWALTPRRSST